MVTYTVVYSISQEDGKEQVFICNYYYLSFMWMGFVFGFHNISIL